MTTILAVVPLRLKSTRVPEKILKKINGSELGVRTLRQVLKIRNPDVTILAAVDDQKTAELLSQVLPQVTIVMTDPGLPSGSDRVYAAAKNYCLDMKIEFSEVKAIVNIQGDMPFLSPSALEKVFLQAAQLNSKNPLVLTPYESWPKEMDPADLGSVKIACDAKGRALYFSRYPIPCSRNVDLSQLKLHVGVYVYTPAALERFCRSEASPLESLEVLEQLRALYYGIPIECIHVECGRGESFRGIDTPGDVEWAEAYSKQSERNLEL